MGNRAVITFDQQPTPDSIGVYLHWNGGAESVLAFLEACNRLSVRDDSDQSYQLARFIQIVGNYFGGTTSLGVGHLKNLDCDNYDNGLFVVSREGNEITIKQSDGKNLADFADENYPESDLYMIREHSYWKPDDTGKNIVDKVLAKNQPVFSKED